MLISDCGFLSILLLTTLLWLCLLQMTLDLVPSFPFHSTKWKDGKEEIVLFIPWFSFITMAYLWFFLVWAQSIPYHSLHLSLFLSPFSITTLLSNFLWSNSCLYSILHLPPLLHHLHRPKQRMILPHMQPSSSLHFHYCVLLYASLPTCTCTCIPTLCLAVCAWT